MQKLLEHQKITVGLLLSIAILLIIGAAYADHLRYFLTLFAAAFVLFAAGLVIIRITRLMNQMRTTLDDPVRITQRVASEIHSMQVIMNRFQEVTLPTTGWSMRFSNLHIILELLDEHKPKNIVEFGSGISTVMIAAWIKQQGCGKFSSFEHVPSWADFTKAKLNRMGLLKYTAVTVTPLASRTACGIETTFYDASSNLCKFREVDFVIVDGPPAGMKGRELNRLAAIDILLPFMSKEFVLVLDDAFRPGEQKVLEIWKKSYPEISFLTYGETTGIAVVTRSLRGS